MKVLSCVLLFTCIIAISLAVGPQESCGFDRECMISYGQFCFCLKPYVNDKFAARGRCVCNMDPNKIKPVGPTGCFTDDECKKLNGSKQLCYCNKQQNQQTGECKCISPLYR